MGHENTGASTRFVDVLVLFTKTCTGAFVLTARRHGLLYIHFLLSVLHFGTHHLDHTILYTTVYAQHSVVGMCVPHGLVVTNVCNVPDLSLSGPRSRMESAGW